MQKRILPLAITAIVILSLIGWNCTKLDTTDIGSDVLPAVDNVNTFDTILEITSSQGAIYDSTTVVGKFDDHALGAINNDPLFGKTNASIYMQIKPQFYPFYFGNTGDTLNGFGAGLDSVVLCLKYKGFWGDSIPPISLEVREVSENKFRDSIFLSNPTSYKPNTSGTIIGTANVDVRRLGDSVKYNNGRDGSVNLVRIKLSQAFADRLYNRDSIKANPVNNAFYNDSIYRQFYNGIAVIANGSGNGLMYINIADTSTKLEVHFKRKNKGKLDSVYQSLKFNAVLSVGSRTVSNSVNHIVRTRSGYPVSNPASTEHYLQTAPGTSVNLHIPGLAGLSNRIVHRAEIIIEQIPTDPDLDNKFSPPAFLYLDLKDSGIASPWYKPIYYDLNTSVGYDPDFRTTVPFFPSAIEFQYFGGFKRDKRDVFGNPIKYYNFNISRYVQQIVTDHTRSYDMRLYAPFNISYLQYSKDPISFSNNIAYGRVRIGSGSNPNYRMRLRIVYSKI